jgi:hypothetical protein
LKIRDRLFWITLRRFWPDWKRVLLIVKPDTVVDRDLFQLAAGAECDPFAIGRPC